jgi:hypothetical protein
VREKARADSVAIVIAMTIPTAADAVVKPSVPMSATQSGENRIPPTLAPL